MGKWILYLPAKVLNHRTHTTDAASILAATVSFTYLHIMIFSSINLALHLELFRENTHKFLNIMQQPDTKCKIS